MNEERFGLVISVVLIAGVGASGLLIGIGFIAAFVVGWGGSLVGAKPQAFDARSFGGIVDGLLALRPIAISQAGLLVLIATPVARVAVAVVGFLREGDHAYVAITLAVLAILVASIFVIR